jgi:hypothetical protein
LNVIHELRKAGRALPEKFPPIPVALPSEGIVGHVEHRRGLYINSALRSSVAAILRDEARVERAAREISDGRLGASDILPIMKRVTDNRDAIRAIKSVRSAITSWDGVVSARGNGLSWDYAGTKASQTTVANNWSSFLRTAGNPGAMSFNAIPGPAAIDSNTTGVWPLPMSLTTEDLYLTNFGANHGSGSQIVLLVDVIQAAGSISATIVTSQTVNTTANLRWTSGEGVLMTLEVTTAFGTATGIPNVTINYTNQAGTAGRSTGAISIGATSLIAGRMFPLQDGPQIRLQAGDYGVRSIQQVTFSASSAGAGAACAAIIYKPHLIMPSVINTAWVERSTPAQVGGIKKLTSVAAGSKPGLGFLVLTSSTSTGVQSYLIETVWG